VTTRTIRRAILIASGLLLAGVVLTGCVAPFLPPPPPTSGATGDKPEQSPQSPPAPILTNGYLQIGDCIDDSPVVKLHDGDIPIVDCTETHYSEVFGFIELTKKDYYPGQDEIFGESGSKCFNLFEPYIGSNVNVSTLETGFYYPSEARYSQGDLVVACTAFDKTGQPLVGSVKGSKK
jgi:hypothetical protein